MRTCALEEGNILVRSGHLRSRHQRCRDLLVFRLDAFMSHELVKPLPSMLGKGPDFNMFGKVSGFKPGTLANIMGKGATPDLNGAKIGTTHL